MSNSGSEGRWSGFDEVPPDFRPNDPNPCRYAWDSDRPVQEDDDRPDQP